MIYVAIVCLLLFALLTVFTEAKTMTDKIVKLIVLSMYAIPIGVLVASLC